MPSCLGIYVEDNLIKYAKVSKERDNVKVESFGIRFYDDLEETLRKIVNETYSYKTPVNINISDENYTTANLFNLLNKNYLKKAINTEFEVFCNDNGKNKNAIEMRYLETQNVEDKDKENILYSYCNKSSIVVKAQVMANYKLNGVYPVPIVIANLAKLKNAQNTAIVNIESKTSVTTVVNGKVYKVNLIDLGMKEILESINNKENSYQKSYDICKNSTIYTLGSQNLQMDENDYMDDIMPTIHTIVERVKDIFATNEIRIENIYLTGLATVVNNLDLYFQENFPDKSCEILTPYFANKSNLKINIKDYIEVNSAISLALEGLNSEFKEINFKKHTLSDGISNALSFEMPKKSKGDKTKEKKTSLNLGVGIPLARVEKIFVRIAAACLIFIIIYLIIEKSILGSINKKNKQITDVIEDTNQKIGEVTNSTRLLTARTSDYTTLLERIEEANKQLTQFNLSKNAVANFLTNLQFAMPNDVQIITIENASEKEISIVAEAEKYEQLGYLIASIKNGGILSNVSSTVGTKQDGIVQVTIKGNLPY